MAMTPKEYDKMLKESSPPTRSGRSLPMAFVVGGLICVVGQALPQCYLSLGLGREEAGAWCSVTLIFLSVLTTGLGWYQRLAKYAGAGTLVPVTHRLRRCHVLPRHRVQKRGDGAGPCRQAVCNCRAGYCLRHSGQRAPGWCWLFSVWGKPGAGRGIRAAPPRPQAGGSRPRKGAGYGALRAPAGPPGKPVVSRKAKMGGKPMARRMGAGPSGWREHPR